jgi:hypothetical protein
MNDEKTDALYEATKDLIDMECIRDVSVDNLPKIIERACLLRDCLKDRRLMQIAGEAEQFRAWFLRYLGRAICDLNGLDTEFRAEAERLILKIEGNKGGAKKGGKR